MRLRCLSIVALAAVFAMFFESAWVYAGRGGGGGHRGGGGGSMSRPSSGSRPSGGGSHRPTGSSYKPSSASRPSGGSHKPSSASRPSGGSPTASSTSRPSSGGGGNVSPPSGGQGSRPTKPPSTSTSRPSSGRVPSAPAKPPLGEKRPSSSGGASQLPSGNRPSTADRPTKPSSRLETRPGSGGADRPAQKPSRPDSSERPSQLPSRPETRLGSDGTDRARAQTRPPRVEQIRPKQGIDPAQGIGLMPQIDLEADPMGGSFPPNRARVSPVVREPNQASAQVRAMLATFSESRLGQPGEPHSAAQWPIGPGICRQNVPPSENVQVAVNVLFDRRSGQIGESGRRTAMTTSSNAWTAETRLGTSVP